MEIAAALSAFWCFYPFLFFNQITGWFTPLFLTLLMLVAYFGISFCQKESIVPKLNYPVKVTASNADALYSLAIRMVRHVKFFTIITFAYLNNAILVLKSNANEIGLFVLLLILVMFAGMFYYIFKMFKFKRLV